MRVWSLLVALIICAAPSLPSHASQNNEAQALHALFDADWEDYLAHNPFMASYLGDKRYNSQWGDASVAAEQAKTRRLEKSLATLQKIDRAKLPAKDKINYDLYQRKLKEEIAAQAFERYLAPMSQRGGIQSIQNLTQYLRLSTEQDYRDWLARLAKLDTQFATQMALMREGMKKGIMPPKIVMSRIPKQLALHLVVKPEDSPFYAPFAKINGELPKRTQAQLQKDAKKVIRDVVLPAYQAFNTFFVEQYLPAARDTVGIWDTPNGRAYYTYLAQSFTTTNMTPDAIHALGKQEVARIKSEMMKIIKEVKFKGSFEEFLTFLRTDPQFYYDNPEDLFNAYLATSKRIDPELVKLFGHLPRMPYGLRPIPEAQAPDTTTAYYSSPAADGSRAGYYYVNLYQPETRPKYEIEVLSVHEAVPGHHLQIAIQQELGDLPNFRKYDGFTAFTEGWGLYSESLGYELGLYQDPYSRFGQLTYEMWRAVRLVVDTGIHYKQWTRQQAIDYFKANAAKSEQDIVNEVDRYIIMPGQALAYKIGQLKISELRAKATRKLGDKFDIRAFHDLVLGSGAVPLDVLETMVDEWIAQH
ncbi:DUF885 domain-containing protein [Simiduia sp. 21SJ11W-1]|uniref:DUF885 domain-containing protein n=1 Tax=Simiduia sp. 21SJ11W-1 TaxID=2909669 RepID=UPI00209C74A6|nr:DUF885 domain-containing protein [Simiduia sp. 21SJ11W-1]UTA47308.1 DUF885 domain-containing protein [Simiduia sp. 21SJ11W-1]